MDSEGKKILVKAFGVEKILSEKVSRNNVKFDQGEFPGVPKEILGRVGRMLPRRYIDVLIGNSHLGLQPVCSIGFGCSNCIKGRCIFRSHFREGYVPLGSLQGDNSIINVIRHVSLTRIAPVLNVPFSQAEQLEFGPVERCTSCKLRISECRICNNYSALICAQEEEEHPILKDHMIFDKSVGNLRAKYPFKADPAILIDNGKEALACQKSQEKRQIKNNTYS